MNRLLSSKYWWLYLIILMVAINMIAAQFHYRLDLTKEKRYTLSEPTKKLLNGLDEDVNVDVFLKGDLKAGLKKLTQSTDELLNEFQ
jgi:ABC-2 type transport system permease protein